VHLSSFSGRVTFPQAPVVEARALVVFILSVFPVKQSPTGKETPMSLTLNEFLQIESEDRNVVAVKHVYIQIAGSLAGGVFLSQLVYWYRPSKKDGQRKIQVRKGGHYWVAKSRNEWAEETGATPRQLDKVLKHLSDGETKKNRDGSTREIPGLHIIEVSHHLFAGRRVLHVRLTSEFLVQYEACLRLNSKQQSNAPENESED
jgi:hypothetical protein